jgi:hypothetical protein
MNKETLEFRTIGKGSDMAFESGYIRVDRPVMDSQVSQICRVGRQWFGETG